MKKSAKLILNFILIAVIFAGVLAGNLVAVRYESEINQLLVPPINNEEEVQVLKNTSQQVASRVMEEGAVLLKNEGNTLPLDYEKHKKVNVFGWRSIDWIYGSEGQNASGGVGPENGDFEENIDIYKALNKYGIEYNESLYNMYYSFKRPDHQSADLRGTHISNLIYLREPKIEDRTYYTEELLAEAKAFSDVAIVVIGRMAGEGMNCDTAQQLKSGPGAVNDTTRHYLEISTEEEALLTWCGENFEKVIVLLNVSNPFECGFLDTIPGIGACLYIGFTGTRAASALPKLLYGEVSPSGRTADTFAYDLFTNPANVWLGGLTYTDYSRLYADYAENIYVGYKWYETADAEGIWADVENVHGKGYEGVVQFPFGHGKSYTSFEWTVNDVSVMPGSDIDDNTKIKFTVTVKNTGNYPGRDVIEAYITAPYYEGEIEKASVSLVAFTKTNVILPGKEETVELTVDANDFASYDCYDKNENGFKGYELDAGEYIVKLMTDSHTVKSVNYGGNSVSGEFKYNVPSDIHIKTDKVTGAEVGNLFTGEDAVDVTPIDGNDGNFTADITWLTRESFLRPGEFAAHYHARACTPSAKIDYYTSERAIEWDNATVDEFGDPVDTSPVTWGANNGLILMDMYGNITDLGKQLGEDYYDEAWEDLLDQISISEALNVVNKYYGSKAISSVGKPFLKDLDGPSQISGFAGAPRGTGNPSIIVLAQTWNPDLAYEFGKAFGDDMKKLDVYGVWGWAIDCHRTAFFGRNHESPSEDGTLAGTIIANAVKGLNTRGRYCFLKHFALYGYYGWQGNNDHIWMTEQALREIYLKPFRKAFVEGGALGAMTTYQGIGGEHSETSVALLTGVLRKEWGFKGAITTDYIEPNYFCDAILRSGGNLGMNVSLGTMEGVTYNASSSARVQHRLREATKQVLYMWLRSDYNERQYLANPDSDDAYILSSEIDSWNWWKPTMYSLDAVIGAGLALWIALLLIKNFVKTDSCEINAAEDHPEGEDKS